MRLRLWLPLLAISFLFPTRLLRAHDMWLEPSSFQPDLASLVSVQLRVGDTPAQAEPAPRDSRRIVRFIAATSEGETPIIGVDETEPAGLLRPQQPGLQILGYHSTPTLIELEAEKFEAYLTDKGLEKISALRAHRGERARKGKERFSRCIKALITVGEAPTGGSDRTLGFPLELIANDNPYQHDLNTPFSARLLFEGKPLAEALVKATTLNPSATNLAARTDEQGQVSFRFPVPGAWVLTAVHMTSAPAGAEADWDSFWASLTFEIPSGQQ